ncbi:hypothetical protein QE372_005107 [Agrobacterium pusense]|nr:hypothetical protein [Agrobacterium pusense]
MAPAAVIRSRHASVSIGRCSTMMSFLPLRTRSTGTSFRSYRPEQSGLLTVPSCRPFSNIADSNISRCSPGTNPEREQKLIWLRQQVLRSARRRTRSSSTRSAIVPQARPIDGEQPVRSTFRLSLLWLGSLACPRRVACWCRYFICSRSHGQARRKSSPINGKVLVPLKLSPSGRRGRDPGGHVKDGHMCDCPSRPLHSICCPGERPRSAAPIGVSTLTIERSMSARPG